MNEFKNYKKDELLNKIFKESIVLLKHIHSKIFKIIVLDH